MDWRFLAFSAHDVSLARPETARIRKPPFYPLNSGNRLSRELPDIRFSDFKFQSRNIVRLGFSAETIQNASNRHMSDGPTRNPIYRNVWKLWKLTPEESLNDTARQLGA